MDEEIKKIMDSESYEEYCKQNNLHGEKAVDFLAKKLHEILGSNHTRVCGSGGSLPTTRNKLGGAASD